MATVHRVASMIVRYQAGVIGDVTGGEHDMAPYRHAMESLEYDKAFDHIWDTVHSLNKYLERVKPWQIAKQRDSDPEAEAHLSEVLTTSVGSLLQVSDLLRPFMPVTAQKINDLFVGGTIMGVPEPLFPRIYKHTDAPQNGKTSQ